jgi:4'-phosphopantetheinyl transferase
LELHLSADERARAARFRFTRDRERFVAARGLLREILSLYLDVEAQRLSFGYGTNGKPFLAEHSALRFNVSHSFDTMLIAVAHEREVGVDIECARSSIAVEEIAETVFSASERQALSSLESEAKRMAFLRFWTRKEAYIKADGRGVSLPLEHIDVSAPTDRVSALDEATGEWRMLTDWTLRTLAAGPDHPASLAVEDQGWELACWQWSE